MKDPKWRNFITEIQAYIDLISGHVAVAKSLYETASASQQDSYPVSYNRSKEMLSKIKDRPQ